MDNLNNEKNLPLGGRRVDASDRTTDCPVQPPLAESTDRLRVERYAPGRKPEWNAFLLKGKNGTFLFQRDYMDYHADRFEDYSLMIYQGEDLCAMLPANLESLHRVVSHGGLTFGGFIVERSASLVEILDFFHAALKYLREHDILFLEYRRIPSFYHTLPSEELDYALFLLLAKLIRRDCALVVNQQDSLTFRKGRKSEISKAKRFGVTIQEECDYAAFWNQVLIPRLMAKYGVNPVHSLEEITLLAGRFPENIRQFNAYHEGQIVAGATIYETPTVAHCQYLGVTEPGQKVGALDLLCGWLIRERYAHKKFFDFGTCNEQKGRVLNHGMLAWKEAFGGRTCVHSFYELQCANYTLLEDILSSAGRPELSSKPINMPDLPKSISKFIHEKALVGPRAVVGERTRVWAFVNIADGAVVGADCNLCNYTFLEGAVRLGNNVTVKCGVHLWDGVVVEDDVFIGPSAVFTNNFLPRSGQRHDKYQTTLLKQGCSIGANATLLPVTVGSWSMVAAGSIVTHDVPAHALVQGSPARLVGWVCRCGEKLDFKSTEAHCICGRTFRQNSETSIQEYK